MLMSTLKMISCFPSYIHNKVLHNISVIIIHKINNVDFDVAANYEWIYYLHPIFTKLSFS